MELILTERERWHDRLDRYHYETHSPEYEKFAAEYGEDVTEECIQQAWVKRRTEIGGEVSDFLHSIDCTCGCNDPLITELCPFHDMGKEFGECICVAKDAWLMHFKATGWRTSLCGLTLPKRACLDRLLVTCPICLDKIITAPTGSSHNAHALGDESC